MKSTKRRFNFVRKAQQQYLSWIIIVAIVVAISFALYRWSIEQARQAGEDIETQTDPIVCSEVGISVKDICQDFRSIRINLTNVNTLDIIGFQIRAVGLYPDEENYLDTRTILVSIIPDDTAKLTILKKTTASQIELIPIAKRNEKNIYCEEQSVLMRKDIIKYC